MPPTRAEFLAYQESFGERYRPMHDTLQGVIKTAAVSFEQLTNDPHWDRFLSYIQAQLDEAKRAQEEWLGNCGNEGNSHALRLSQMQYQYHHGRVKALEEVMGLPSQLRSAYEQVKETAVPSSP